MAEHEYKLNDDGGAFPSQALIAALDEFASAERYSSRRDQILREIKNQPFSIDLVFQSAERTYGYTSDDRFRDGLTVLATIKDTTHLVSLQMPADYNDQLRGTDPSSQLPATLVVIKWNSVSDAFQALFALDVPEGAAPDDDPVEDPPAPSPEDEGLSAEFQALIEPDVPEDAPTHDDPVDDPSAPSPEDEDLSGEDDSPAVPVEEPAISEDSPPPEEDAEAPPPPYPPPTDSLPPAEPSSSSVVDLTDSLQVPDPAADVSTKPTDPPATDIEDDTLTMNSMLFELTNGSTPLAGRSLAEFIGYKFDVDPDIVDRAIMTFWSHYLDPKRFMDGELHVSVPFVGRFSLFRRTGGSVGVALQQVDIQTLSTAVRRIKNMQRDDWVHEYKATGTVPRDERFGSATVAVEVAEENDLDLTTSYKLVLELMTLLTTLLSLGTRRLRFPSIGEFYPITSPRGNPVYKFRVYKSLLRMLSSIPLEKYAALVGAPREDSKLSIHKREKSNNQKQGAWGCFGILAVILFFVFFINDGCSDVMREFGSLENAPSIRQGSPVSDATPFDFLAGSLTSSSMALDPAHTLRADRKGKTSNSRRALSHARTNQQQE